MTGLTIEKVALFSPIGGLHELARAVDGFWPPLIQSDFLMGALKKMSTSSLRRMPRLARLALVAADILGVEQIDCSQNDCALIFATNYGSVKSTFDFLDSIIEDGASLASPTAFSHSVSNMVAALIAQYFKLTGPCLTLSNTTLSPALDAAVALAFEQVTTVILGVAAENLPLMEQIEKISNRPVTQLVEGAVLFKLTRVDKKNRGKVFLELTDVKNDAVMVDNLGNSSLASAFRIALAWLEIYNDRGAESIVKSIPGEKIVLKWCDDYDF